MVIEPGSSSAPEQKRSRPRLVSVVIPTRNAQETLGEQLEALASQTYEGDWEVVVVDNGSSDASAAIARSFHDRLPALRVVDASRKAGINVARNAGADAARGEFIAICDADDVCSPGWLAALVAAAPSFDIVKGRLETSLLNRSSELGWYNPRPRDLMRVRHGFLPGASASNCGMWTRVVRSLGGWNEDYVYGSTGTEFFWRAQLAGFSLGPAEEALVHKRLRSGLRPLMRQQFRQGLNQVRLYREFRDRGMPRSSTDRGLKAWLKLILGLPGLVSSRRARGKWLRQAAMRAGRLAGSLRFRTVFL